MELGVLIRLDRSQKAESRIFWESFIEQINYPMSSLLGLGDSAQFGGGRPKSVLQCTGNCGEQ